MSIATEITRLQTAKADLKTAIENKGVTVPSATKIDGYASLVNQIPTGQVYKSVLIISIETGSTVGIYDSTYTTLIQQATEHSPGEYWITGLDDDTYYIKATKGINEATLVYTITEFGVYRLTMHYWVAYVTVAFPKGSTLVSISNGNVTYTCPSADLALGTYTFAVVEAGTYAVTATYTGFSLTANNVVITNNGDTGSTECRLWLYDNSYNQSGSTGANVCYAVTGGYGGMSGNIGQGIKYNSNNVSLNSNQTSGMLHPVNQIDLTGFNTLHVECRNDKGTWAFGVQATIGTYLAQGTYGTSQSTVTLDITGVTGLAYVGIGMNNGTGYIYNMWLT